MTDTEIIEALAVKVMGWTVKQSVPVSVMGQTYTAMEFYAPDGTRRTLAGWNPLTDANASKQVREKLAERFDTVQVRFDKVRGSEPPQWRAIVGSGRIEITDCMASFAIRVRSLTRASKCAFYLHMPLSQDGTLTQRNWMAKISSGLTRR